MRLRDVPDDTGDDTDSDIVTWTPAPIAWRCDGCSTWSQRVPDDGRGPRCDGHGLRAAEHDPPIDLSDRWRPPFSVEGRKRR